MAAQLDRQVSGNELRGLVGRTRPLAETGLLRFSVRKQSAVPDASRAVQAGCPETHQGPDPPDMLLGAAPFRIRGRSDPTCASHGSEPLKSSLYAPVVDGFSQRVAEVRYEERPPPQDLAELVHVFWELRTLAPLPVDFLYHAMVRYSLNWAANPSEVTSRGGRGCAVWWWPARASCPAATAWTSSNRSARLLTPRASKRVSGFGVPISASPLAGAQRLHLAGRSRGKLLGPASSGFGSNQAHQVGDAAGTLNRDSQANPV